jgi:hypothetical protein
VESERTWGIVLSPQIRFEGLTPVIIAGVVGLGSVVALITRAVTHELTVGDAVLWAVSGLLGPLAILSVVHLRFRGLRIKAQSRATQTSASFELLGAVATVATEPIRAAKDQVDMSGSGWVLIN